MTHLRNLISFTLNHSNISSSEKILLPFDFDFKLFLEKQASINSFSTCIDWLEENDEINYRTKKRYLDICWSIYGKSMSFIDDEIINYHKKFIKRYWKIKIENNTLHTLLLKYIENNKDRWSKISFHMKNIRNIVSE